MSATDTVTTRESDVLVGTKSVLRYLRDKHGYTITRSQLWRLSHGERSGRDEAPKYPPFPIKQHVDGRLLRVVASRRAVDRWMQKNLHGARDLG